MNNKDKSGWNISDLWKNRKIYPLSAIAYIACGLEPKEFDEIYPEMHLSTQLKAVCRDIEHIILDKIPDDPPPRLEDWNRIDFERDQAIRLINDLGVPNFLAEPMKLNTQNGLAEAEQHNYISEDLALLNEAASTFWLNADPADRDTHPINEKVIEWLKSKGFSDASAKQGATIIRPKWAAKGRR